MWGRGVPSQDKNLLNSQLIMQGYMHFDGEKLLVAKNREQERLNRPTGGLKM